MAISTIIKLTETDSGHEITCSIHSDGKQKNERPNYITRISFQVNNRIVTVFDTNRNISDNPLFGIHLASLKVADRVSATWISSNGNRGRVSVQLTDQD